MRDSSWDGFTELVGSANSPRFEGNTVTAQRIRIAGAGHRVTITGNTLLDGAGIVWGDPGSTGLVEDNDIVGYIVGDAGDDVIIRRNRIRGGGEGGDGRPGSAIGISGSGSAIIVEGNEISDSPNGIDVYGSGATPRISGNIITGSSVAAILVDLGAAPTIDGNTIEKNATGIEVRGTANPVMTGNTLCENGSNLVVPDGSTLTLDGNTTCQASEAP